MKRFAFTLLAAASLPLLSPATAIAKDTSKKVLNVTTSQPGADVYVFRLKDYKRLSKCETPCTMKFKTNEPFTVDIFKDGFIQTTHYITEDQLFTEIFQIAEDLIAFDLDDEASLAAQRKWYGIQSQISIDIGMPEACANPVADDANTDAKPCFRFAPLPPMQAERSGHCDVVMDIEPDGSTSNVRLETCSEEVFEIPVLATLAYWKYYPKMENGIAVKRIDVKPTVKFKITDKRGNEIPALP